MIRENKYSEDSMEDSRRPYDSERVRCSDTRFTANDPGYYINGKLTGLQAQSKQRELDNNQSILSDVRSNDIKLLKKCCTNKSKIDFGKFKNKNNDNNLSSGNVINTEKLQNPSINTTKTNGVECIKKYIDIVDSTTSVPETNIKITKRRIAESRNCSGDETYSKPHKISKLKDQLQKTNYRKVPDIDIYERIIGTAYQNIKTLHNKKLDNLKKVSDINNDLKIENQKSIDKFITNNEKKFNKSYVSSTKRPICQFCVNKKKPKKVYRSKSFNISSQQNQTLDNQKSLLVMNKPTNVHTDRSKACDANYLPKCNEAVRTIENERVSTTHNYIKTREITTGNEKSNYATESIEDNSIVNKAKPQEPIVNDNEPVGKPDLHYATTFPKKRRNTIFCSSSNNQNITSYLKICKMKYFNHDKIVPHFHKHTIGKEINLKENMNIPKTNIEPDSNRIVKECPNFEKLNANLKTNANTTTLIEYTATLPPLSNPSSMPTNLYNNNYAATNIYNNYNNRNTMLPSSVPKHIFIENSVVSDSSYKNAQRAYSNTSNLINSNLSDVSRNIHVSSISSTNQNNSCHKTSAPETQITAHCDLTSPKSIPVLIHRKLQPAQHNTLNSSKYSLDSCAPNYMPQNIDINNSSFNNPHPMAEPVIQPNTLQFCPPSSYPKILYYNLTNIDTHATSKIPTKMTYECESLKMSPIHYRQLQFTEDPILNTSNFNKNLSAQCSKYHNNIPTEHRPPVTNKSKQVLPMDSSVLIVNYSKGIDSPITSASPLINKFSYSYDTVINPNQFKSLETSVLSKIPKGITFTQYALPKPNSPIKTVVLNKSSNNNMHTVYPSESISTIPASVNESDNNIFKTYSKQLINKSSENTIPVMVQHNTIENNKEDENITQSKFVNSYSPLICIDTKKEPFREVTKDEINVLCHSSKIEEHNTKIPSFNCSTLKDPIFSVINELFNEDLDQIKVMNISESENNNTDVTKYSKLLKALKTPLEVENSLLIAKKSPPEQSVNKENLIENKTLPYNGYSPPILPTLTFQEIFEKIENENFFIHNYNFNLTNDLDDYCWNEESYYDEQDSRNLSNKQQPTEDKNKKAKKITLSEYKRRLSNSVNTTIQ